MAYARIRDANIRDEHFRKEPVRAVIVNSRGDNRA